MKPHARPRDPRSLAPRQAAVLLALREFTERVGIPPTLREIGEATGIGSTNGVMDHLKALEKKGYIQRLRCRARGIRLVRGAQEGAP